MPSRKTRKTGAESTGGEQSTVDPKINLAALWSTEYERFRMSRSRIRAAGQWRRNEVMPQVPWANPDPFRVMLPHATTMGQAVVNFLARRRPQVHREPLGSDPRAQRISSRIELWLQALLDDELQVGGENLWDANLAFATHDGEWGVIVQPDTSHWDEMLDYTVEEGSQDRIAPHFARDKKGRAADDPYYQKPGRTFDLDTDASAAAFTDYQTEAKAREIPFIVRLIPAEMCVPIGIDPQTGKVDALLIRSDRTAISLKKDGFDCVIQGPGIAAMQLATSLGQGGSAIAGSGTLYSLYELWIADDDGCKVWYQIGSAGGENDKGLAYDTTRYGDSAMIDLAKKYPGFFTDVPGGYFFGCHFANETDPNKKGYPFIYVFLSLLRGVNQTLSAKVAHMYLTAFGGWNSRLTAEDLNTWIELGRPTDVEIRPGKVNFVTGELSPAVHPGTGKDVDEFLQMALGVLRELGPQGVQPSPDQSGFGQGVSIASADASFNQLTSGAKMAMEIIAECLLEQCAAISAETSAPVPVYTHINPKTGGKQDHVELSGDDLDGDYEVDINLPTPKFQNLALMQAGAGFVQQGLLPEIVWLEEMAGFEQPEHIQDLKWVEKQMNSAEGTMYTLDLAAKYSGEQGLQKFQKLLQQQKVGPGGTPSAAMPSRPGTGQDGAGGPNTGNPAAAALAGIAGGASQTQAQSNVIQATGQSAPVAA